MTTDRVGADGMSADVTGAGIAGVAWEIVSSPAPVIAATQLEREQRLVAERALTDGPPVALIWQSEPALVVTQSERYLPCFGEAARIAAAEGWPVSVRSTGGSAVAMGPGVVNVGLIRPWRVTRPTLEEGFRLICAPLIGALARFGVTATTGSAPGSYCDGRFNVLAGSRKIAGTSQRHVMRGSRGALLLHATVIVDADPGELTAVVAKFYERAGKGRELSADSVTSLARCVGGSASSALPQVFISVLSEVLSGLSP